MGPGREREKRACRAAGFSPLGVASNPRPRRFARRLTPRPPSPPARPRVFPCRSGDHTVKLIDCRTGECLRTLTGHRRTPWVVRFHPTNPNILASGSLDHEVRLWNAATAECVLCFDFGKPIASLAFHSEGDVLAVASGHKLYTWRYVKAMAARREAAEAERGESTAGPTGASVAGSFPRGFERGRGSTHGSTPHAGSTPGMSSASTAEAVPCISLRTRRSLRAVHFHPHGAPLLLSAEVNETSEQDVPPLRAMTGPHPVGEWETAYTAAREAAAAAMGATAAAAAANEAAGGIGGFGGEGVTGGGVTAGRPRTTYIAARDAAGSDAVAGAAGAAEPVSPSEDPEMNMSRLRLERDSCPSGASASGGGVRMDVDGRSSGGDEGEGRPRLDPSSEGTGAMNEEMATEEDRRLAAEAAAAAAVANILRQQRGRHDSRRSGRAGEAAGEGERLQGFTGTTADPAAAAAAAATTAAATAAYQSAMAQAMPTGGMLRVVDSNGQPAVMAASVNAAAAAAAAAAVSSAMGNEQPCTVKLRLWPYNHTNPLAPLSAARLTIPHAVLCSEMGAHFSPCGRLLAACVACVPKDAEAPVPGQPIPHLVYELRVYSLEERNFGEVLAARSVRAAHCLTSIQFSPTSEHILLAYGRRHSSLLLLVADGGSCVTVHTILEVYRISDMNLVRVLPSAEDEVNVACFHPCPGGGLAYGTKEGRLRILRHDCPPPKSPVRPMAIGRCLEDELLEVLDWSGVEREGLSDGDSESD